MKRLSAATGLLLFVVPAVAQGAAERFVADAAQQLHRHAQRWFDVGFANRARKIWVEVVTEYDGDHEPSWNALGYVRLGTAWAPDSSRPYPERDTAPPSRATALERAWRKLGDKLAAGHRRVAERAAADGDEAVATAHYRRVLRFRPDDAAAAAALQLAQFDGLFGTPEELAILQRSHYLRHVVAWLRTYEPVVEDMDRDARQPSLARAGVEHRGVRTANFVVWGDVSRDWLVAAATHAERALWLARSLFRGFADYRDEPLQSAELAFFTERDAWEAVVRANEDVFEQGEMQFLLESCAAARVHSGARWVYVAYEDLLSRLLDHVVRAVVVDLAAMRPAALKEGIGHALVNLLLGRNLVFLLGRAGGESRPGTVAGGVTFDAEEAAMVDVNDWVGMVLEQAWRQDDAPFARLPAVPAHRMGGDDRVLAWAVCDYLMRRDPALLRALSDAGVGAAVPGDVWSAFGAMRGTPPLDELQSDWRRFWTEEGIYQDTVLRRPPTRVAGADRRVRGWLDAINRLRVAQDIVPIGWVRSRDSAAEALARARGGGRAVPAGAVSLARRAIVGQGDPRAAAVDAWLARPADRHRLLDPGLALFECADANGATVLAPATRRGGAASITAYPRDGATGIAAAVACDTLPPTLVAAVTATPRVEIGYPLTLHVHGADVDALDEVECRVRCDDAFVEGVVLSGAESPGGAGFAHAGVHAFYPRAPFGAGTTVTVRWSWTDALGRRRELDSAFAIR